MSNDESAWYAASEPSTARLLPEEPVQPAHLRIGTVIPDSAPLEPQQRVLRTAEEGQQSAEPLQPLQPFQRVEAEPERTLRRGEAEPLQPFQRVEAEPERTLRRGEAEPLQPFQRGVPAQEPERTLRRGEAEPLQPFERGVPAQEAASERTLRRGETAGAKRVAASDGGGSGNAGAGFQVDPEQYRAAVSPMLAASEQLADLHRSLSAFLTSMESQNPWGNDESGKKFAEGEKGYLKYSHDTMAVVKGLPGALKNIAEGLKAMAASYENADENVVADLGGIESTVQMPTAPSLPSAPVNPIISTRPIQSGRH